MSDAARGFLAWLAGASARTGILVLGCALGAEAQTPVPVGGEFQVNSYTTSSQGPPSLAARADGDFVVVWQSVGSAGGDTSGSSIQGQRYDSAARPLGSEFQVNSYTTSFQDKPSVAMDADGHFVVVWDSLGSTGSDSDGWRIEGQRYDSAGTPLGSEFQINSYTTNYQRGPSVAVDTDGDFVVVWQSNGSAGRDTNNYSIQGQRYDSGGIPLGAEFQVNAYTTGPQVFPSVAVRTNKDFVVVWTSAGSAGPDTSGFSIQGQRYDGGGRPLGAEFQVNSYSIGDQSFPSAAVDANGDFVVVWTSAGSAGRDTSGSSIQGQRYDSAGIPLGSEFQVNSYTTDYQGRPSVAVESEGDFVVVWTSGSSLGGPDGSSSSIQGQRYDSAGRPHGDEFGVNSYITSSQRDPSVTVAAGGDFVVAWASDGSAGSDTDSFSVQGQRFTVRELVDSDADGAPDAEDNCVEVPNGPAIPDAGGNVQLDVDTDGFGNACDCDFNQDGACGQPDYSVFLACFGALVPGSGPADDPTCEESDMNGDDGVGQPDYSLFISRFGGTPGP